MQTKLFFIASLLTAICMTAGCMEQSKSIIDPDAAVQLAAGDFKFVEGPVSDKAGNIYFTDIPNNRILKYSIDGTLTTFLENSQASNGLYFDKDAELIACASGTGKLITIDVDGNIKDLITQYKGSRFNSPNDLWIDKKGGIYFTDPRYGNRDNLPQDGEHVYYVKPDRKTVIRVIGNMTRPNGIIGTPDGKTLYVADAGESMTYKYTINKDGTLSNEQLFVDSGSDGMTIDEHSNIYLTTDAVMIYNPQGQLIQRIEVPERPANITFGGPGKNTLFITARKSLYKIDTNTKSP